MWMHNEHSPLDYPSTQKRTKFIRDECYSLYSWYSKLLRCIVLLCMNSGVQHAPLTQLKVPEGFESLSQLFQWFVFISSMELRTLVGVGLLFQNGIRTCQSYGTSP